MRNRWTTAIALGILGCSTPAPAPKAPTPPGKLLVHRNKASEPPVLCEIAATGGQPDCGRKTGLFAGPARPGHPHAVLIAVEDSASGHRERLGLWQGPRQHVRFLTPWAGSVRAPAWMPDGSAIIVASDADGFSDLWRVALTAGAEPTALRQHPSGTFEPDVHPNGNTVVAASSEHGTADLFTLPTTAGEAQRLTSMPGDEIRPKWSHDGAHIAFMHMAGEGLTVWTMAPGHDAKPLLPTLPDPQLDMAWSPTSSKIAIVTGPSPDQTHLVIADGVTGAVLTHIGDDKNNLEHPAWSPDGAWIAFTCRTADARWPQVCVAAADGQHMRVVATAPQHGMWMPRWLTGS